MVVPKIATMVMAAFSFRAVPSPIMPAPIADQSSGSRNRMAT